eukprot:scaffold5326_cov191-Amphora_coffeaeformis.AAC.2
MNAQQFLQQGNVALFQGRFDNAVQCYRQSMLISSQDVSMTGGDRSVAAMSFSTQPVMESMALDLPEILMTTSSETISSHNVFDIFDRAFVALPNASPAVSSVICIYNIALTHHTQAMLRAYNSAYHFQRAHHFYKLAWKALLTCSSEQRQRHQPEEEHPQLQDLTFVPVSLALLNNMGHIACHFWNKADVESALHGILEALPLYLEYRAANLCHPDVLFFYSYRCYEYVEALNHAPSA